MHMLERSKTTFIHRPVVTEIWEWYLAKFRAVRLKGKVRDIFYNSFVLVKSGPWNAL